MRRGLSMLAIVAMLGQGPAAAVPPERVRQPGGQGLCRQPEPLPRLGAEEQGQQRPYPVPMPRPVMSREMRDASVPVEAPSALPAPPPPAADAAYEGPAEASGELVLTGSHKAEGKARADAARHHPEPDIMPPPHRWPAPQPQAGQLTAGEHDDLLNP